jgi:hypothetical protein
MWNKKELIGLLAVTTKYKNEVDRDDEKNNDPV